MNKDSRIYIAGHRGLVGSAILKNLQQKGYTNFITKTHQELDLTNQKAVTDFFHTEKPEYVFLAAAKVGGIVANNTYRADFIYENLQIQNNVIHQSYKNGVKKLLFLGSTCIYPKNAPQPMKEEYLLTGELEYTNEPYAIAKIAGIKMCESYNLQYGTNFISVMPTNLYGPNDNFDLEKSHVLPALIRKIHLSKCLEEGNWNAIREDLNKRPVKEMKERSNDSTNERMSEEEILEILNKYGISFLPSHSITPSPHRSLVSVEIWGAGKPMREFLWSEDMADACVFIFENVDFKDTVIAREAKQSHETTRNVILPARLGGSNVTLSAVEGGVEGVVEGSHSKETRNTHINIGTGIDISISDLAALIKQTIGFNGSFVYNTSKPDGTLKKLTDVSKLHQLGWKHGIELNEGIRKMYEWYKVRKH